MSRELKIGAAVAVIVIVAIGMSFWSVFVKKQSKATDDQTFAQEYSLAFTDYSGHSVLLSSFRRKVLVAYTWASWCTYCGAELQNLSALKSTYGDDVQFVAINRGEPLQTARDYTAALSLDGLVLLLDQNDAFFKSIGGYAMPETIFIDNSGAVLFHQRGPMKIDQVRAKIDELLGRTK